MLGPRGWESCKPGLKTSSPALHSARPCARPLLAFPSQACPWMCFTKRVTPSASTVGGQENILKPGVGLSVTHGQWDLCECRLAV